MKNLIYLFVLLISTTSVAQPEYDFNGTMNERTLELYLDKAITMQGQSDVEGSSNLSEVERVKNINMILDVKAKFVHRIVGWWESGWGQEKMDQIMTKAALNISDLHAIDPQIICQAAIFEYVSATVEQLAIPDWVFTDFGLQVVNRNFDYDAMLYDPPASQYYIYPNPCGSTGRPMTESERSWIPDISKLETRLWFYYLAKRYIDAGCEAIHWGQVELMDLNDPGHHYYWDLFSKVRLYGASKNRGVLLCDAHSRCNPYYDLDPNNPLPNWQRQLLFDFQSSPLYNKETTPCTVGNQPCIVTPNESNILGLSACGLSPLGWSTMSIPYLMEFDNGGADPVAGCSYNTDHSWTTWGWDDITWFSKQSSSYRNSYLKYTYYKIKCLDPKGHVTMPGMRGCTNSNQTGYLYRANTGNYNQQTTIKNIFAGSYSYQGWYHSVFSDQAFCDPPTSHNAMSSLIFVGDDKVFYISDDKRIHGYVLYGNQWLTVSPSWAADAAGQPIANQVQAAGNLIASSDGSYLYYRGTNGYVYRYSINSVNYPWSYTYSAMPTNTAMQNEHITAYSSMNFVGSDKIYYIGNESTNGNAKRIHGFVKISGVWSTVSPPWAADAAGQPIGTQVQSAGDLVANPDGTYLFYRGTDGYVYRYSINTLNYPWSYTYSTMPTNSAMQAQNITAYASMICPANNRIYYIANEAGNQNKKRIHGFIYYNNTWNTTSPTWSSDSHGYLANNQTQGASDLGMSPDGTKLLYRGSDNQLHGFTVTDDWNYYYYDLPTINNSLSVVTNSLKFKNNSEVFYIAYNYFGFGIYWDKKVHEFIYGEAACYNNTIQVIEPGFLPPKLSEEVEESEIGSDKKIDLLIIPDPADNELTVSLPEDIAISEFMVVNLLGQKIENEQVRVLTNQINLNTQRYLAGYYMILIKDENGKVRTANFVVTH
ncbi:MAG TPA: T9SS type A sorting domain-containing protein [Chitinophagales bacterium]|nr:T9SS type A sorting domain-containing protein [Chitinophagales bacterium]